MNEIVNEPVPMTHSVQFDGREEIEVDLYSDGACKITCGGNALVLNNYERDWLRGVLDLIRQPYRPVTNKE